MLPFQSDRNDRWSLIICFLLECSKIYFEPRRELTKRRNDEDNLLRPRICGIPRHKRRIMVRSNTDPELIQLVINQQRDMNDRNRKMVRD